MSNNMIFSKQLRQMLKNQNGQSKGKLIAVLEIVDGKISNTSQLGIWLSQERILEMFRDPHESQESSQDKENLPKKLQIFQTTQKLANTQSNTKTSIVSGYINIEGELAKVIVIKRNKKKFFLHQLHLNELFNEIHRHKNLRNLNSKKDGLLLPIGFSEISSHPTQEELDKIFIIFEQLKGYHIMEKQILPKGFAEKVFIFKRICNTVRKFHENGFIHRDISLRNILIKQDDYLLSDLGLAIKKNLLQEKLEETEYKAVGTPGYMCPMIFNAEKQFIKRQKQSREDRMRHLKYFQYGLQIDVWALGQLFANQFVDSSKTKEYEQLKNNQDYFNANQEQFQQMLTNEVAKIKSKSKIDLTPRETELYKEIQRICKKEVKQYYELRKKTLKKQDEAFLKNDYDTQSENSLPELPNFIDKLIQKIQKFERQSSAIMSSPIISSPIMSSSIIPKNSMKMSPKKNQFGINFQNGNQIFDLDSEKKDFDGDRGN